MFINGLRVWILIVIVNNDHFSHNKFHSVEICVFVKQAQIGFFTLRYIASRFVKGRRLQTNNHLCHSHDFSLCFKRHTAGHFPNLR